MQKHNTKEHTTSTRRHMSKQKTLTYIKSNLHAVHHMCVAPKMKCKAPYMQSTTCVTPNEDD